MKNIKNIINKYKTQILLSVLLLLAVGVLEVLILRGKITAPETINIFVIDIHIYSFTMLMGVLILIFGADIVKKFDKDLKNIVVDEIVIYSLIPAIIGARLWHVVTDWSLYDSNRIEALYIWNGGLGIYGAVIGVIIGVWIYSIQKKRDLFKIINIAAFLLPISQIIGRYGNFFNQELYGPPTDVFWGMFIREENRILGFENNEFFHPAFLYEQIGNALLFAVNLIIFYKLKLKGNFFIGTWLSGYGLVRFIVEFYRLSDKDHFGLSINQLVSLVLILLGIIYLIFEYKKLQNGKK